MRARVASFAFMMALLALLVGGGGCEAIVGKDVPAYTCTGKDLRACPAGMYCKGAGCAPCEKVDRCDGLDNDCDGKVDNGPGADHDGDGFPWCGHLAADGMHIVDVDCNDNDATVFPGAKEICNGIDDNCDGIIDNPELVCPAGFSCAPRTRECLPNAQACTSTNCAPPKVCDASTQRCADPNANFDLGKPCASDKECKSKICGDTSTLGSVASAGGVCTTPCCTSDTCDPGFVCYAAGKGGKYCVAARLAGRLGAGTLRGGEACGTNNQACRSGVCAATKCVDTCCADGDCLNGTTCRLELLSGHTVYACGDSPGGGGRNSFCSSDNSCKSAFCAQYDGSNNRCITTCCGSVACGTIFLGSTPVACVNVRGPQTAPDYNSACAAVPAASANQRFGDPCASSNDCLSTFCEAGRCTDLCCVDRDCPQSNVCRPASDGQLRCVKP